MRRGWLAAVSALGILLALTITSGCKRTEEVGCFPMGRCENEVDKAAAALDWGRCVAEADKRLRTDRSDVWREKKAKCELERRNEPRFEAYRAAVAAGDNDRAVVAHEEIDQDSVYYAMATASWAQEQQKYVERFLRETGGNGSVGPAPAPARSAPGLPAVALRLNYITADGGVDPVVDDFLDADFEAANDAAREAIQKGNHSTREWRLLAASACHLNRPSEVREAWPHLDEIDRRFVAYACANEHVTLP